MTDIQKVIEEVKEELEAYHNTIGELRDNTEAYIQIKSFTWLQQLVTALGERDAEIERLRGALECIANYCHLGESCHAGVKRCIKIAAAALEEERRVSE